MLRDIDPREIVDQVLKEFPELKAEDIFDRDSIRIRKVKSHRKVDIVAEYPEEWIEDRRVTQNDAEFPRR